MIFYLYCWLFKKFGKKNLESYLRFFSFIPNINNGGCYLVASILRKKFGGTIVYAMSNENYDEFKYRLKLGKITSANHVYLKLGKNYIDSRGIYRDYMVKWRYDNARKITKKYHKAILRKDCNIFWNNSFSESKKETLKKLFL